MSDWKVHRSKSSCNVCQCEIEPGSHFWSRLVDNPEPDQESLLRQDYCDAHWPVEGESFCYWKTTRSEEENKGPRMLDSDTLLTLFRELPESEEPRKLNFRYLLALILMRKKVLREYQKGAAVLKLTDTVEQWDIQIPDMDSDSRKLAEEDIGQLIVGLPESEAVESLRPNPEVVS